LARNALSLTVVVPPSASRPAPPSETLPCVIVTPVIVIVPSVTWKTRYASAPLIAVARAPAPAMVRFVAALSRVGRAEPSVIVPAGMSIVSPEGSGEALIWVRASRSEPAPESAVLTVYVAADAAAGRASAKAARMSASSERYSAERLVTGPPRTG
jgi:hypothetical protein